MTKVKHKVESNQELLLELLKLAARMGMITVNIDESVAVHIDSDAISLQDDQVLIEVYTE